MSTRLISPWKRPNSTQFWFRMVVPPRYRKAVGKSEIKQSLGTDQIGEARRLCAIRQNEWLKKFELSARELKAHEARDGTKVIDGHFDRLASELGGMDSAIACELEGMAIAEFHYLHSSTCEELGLAPGEFHPLVDNPYPAYREPKIRDLISARRWALSSVGSGALAGREAVERALHLGFLPIAASVVEEAFEAAGFEIDHNDGRFKIAARHLLERLSQHSLPQVDEMRTSWPTPAVIAAPTSDDHSALANGTAVVEAESCSSVTAVPSAADSPLRQRILGTPSSAMRISEVYEDWAARQPAASRKLCDEWRVSIRRFVELFGDLNVAEVNRDMIIDFREAMSRLPTRPKKEVACLPLLEQIDVARERDLPLLAGATIGKLVTGLRVTLEHAVDPLRLIAFNPGSTVKVKGAKSDVDARLPFSPEDLRTIYSSSLMTDPETDMPGSYFWLMMLAPLSGLRIEEMGKLRPSNIRCENGIWYAAIERDTRRQRKAETAAGTPNKGAKTSSSYRDVALHWILIEAGFLNYVERQRQTGAEWLFPDLEHDQYGNRTKKASRDLIKHIRKLGITDEEKVFHSFRHSMKRACRRTSMKEEIADLLAGHAPDSIGRKYGAGAELNVLQDAVNLIEYEHVDWDPVIASAKARFKGLPAKPKSKHTPRG